MRYIFIAMLIICSACSQNSSSKKSAENHKDHHSESNSIASNDTRTLKQVKNQNELAPKEKNPIREAFKSVPETAIVKFEGYSVWDPSVIKVGDTYHLFFSRWERAESGEQEKKVWKRGHIARASSKSLFGPYEFQSIVLDPKTHPWAKVGLYGSKVMRHGDRFLLSYSGFPKGHTGIAWADSIEGPWVPAPFAIHNLNSPAILIEDGLSAYMIASYESKPHNDGKNDSYMSAHRSHSVEGLYEIVKPEGNRLPKNYEMTDSTIWWANNQYNVIANDIEDKASGIVKSFVYYTSKNGVDYELYSKIPILSRRGPIIMQDGRPFRPLRLERPQVFTNEQNEVEALLFALRLRQHGHDAILIQPVDKFYPEN